MTTMTKGEREQLGQLIRKREKVLKAAADERAAAMLADFDAQSAKIYAFDDDEVWRQATEAAEKAVAEAQRLIEERCKEIGIPPEFSPGFHFGWHGRGQNAARDRRAELRRAAKSRIEAITLEAKTKIERMSLEAQTQVIAAGLDSDAAKSFLEGMAPIEALMPPVSATEIKQLVDERRAAGARRWEIN